MRNVKLTSKFKKQYRKTLKSPNHFDLDNNLNFVLDLLIADVSLPDKFHDHALIGNFVGSRECHIKPDLLLMYRKIGNDLLLLERIGSHSEILK